MLRQVEVEAQSIRLEISWILPFKVSTPSIFFVILNIKTLH